MRQIADQTFVEQQARYSLRGSCEHCVHFNPESQLCAEGYPNHEHRRLPEKVGESLCFCKMFELC